MQCFGFCTQSDWWKKRAVDLNENHIHQEKSIHYFDTCIMGLRYRHKNLFIKNRCANGQVITLHTFKFSTISPVFTQIFMDAQIYLFFFSDFIIWVYRLVLLKPEELMLSNFKLIKTETNSNTGPIHIDNWLDEHIM